MLRRLFLLVSVFWGLVFAAPALACQCNTQEVDPQTYLREATLVFEGEVLDRPLSNWIRNTTTFRILASLKGKMGSTVTLDQSRAGNCAAIFAAGERVRIVANGNAEEGYWTSACSLAYLRPELQGNEIWALATANRQHTLALGGSDISAADTLKLRQLISWYAEYGSFEDGLDAVDRLLALEPGDLEALQFKAQFVTALKNKARGL